MFSAVTNDTIVFVFYRDVFSAVTNDTIVFVFGDHGMTITGDHGGETPLETDSALLVYSPISLFDPKKVINVRVSNNHCFFYNYVCINTCNSNMF